MWHAILLIGAGIILTLSNAYPYFLMQQSFLLIPHFRISEEAPPNLKKEPFFYESDFSKINLHPVYAEFGFDARYSRGEPQ